MAASPPPPAFRIAREEDVEAIHDMPAKSARAGVVLPRPASEIRQHIGSFVVAENGGQVVGSVSLRDYGQGLFEVRSLVVHPGHRSLRIGSHLVSEVVAMGRARRGHSIFALTYHPDLFRRLGFRVVPKEMFPRKVWADCRHCAKQHCCDETALLLDLGRSSAGSGFGLSAGGE
jgi:amino-acid N-acetyltransferase